VDITKLTIRGSDEGAYLGLLQGRHPTAHDCLAEHSQLQERFPEGRVKRIHQALAVNHQAQILDEKGRTVKVSYTLSTARSWVV
jgi:hypothetical protein